MSSSQDYRRFASRCLEIEHHATDAHTRALTLQMAQICHQLADELDSSHKDESNGIASTGAHDAGA